MAQQERSTHPDADPNAVTLADRLSALLNDIATRHCLRLERDDVPYLDLSATFPEQPGLSFPLWITLSDDELTCGMDDRWYGNFFSLDDPTTWRIVATMLEGFVTGDTRAVLYSPLWRTKVFWSVIQVREGAGWKAVSTGMGCAIPPIFRRTIVRNGTPPESDTPRLAWGTLALLTLVAFFVLRFLR